MANNILLSRIRERPARSEDNPADLERPAQKEAHHNVCGRIWVQRAHDVGRYIACVRFVRDGDDGYLSTGFFVCGGVGKRSESIVLSM